MHHLGAESMQLTMAPSSNTGQFSSLHPREADCQLVSRICSYSAMWTALSHPQTRIQLNPRDVAQRSKNGCGRTRSELRDRILLLKSSSGQRLVSPSNLVWVPCARARVQASFPGVSSTGTQAPWGTVLHQDQYSITSLPTHL